MRKAERGGGGEPCAFFIVTLLSSPFKAKFFTALASALTERPRGERNSEKSTSARKETPETITPNLAGAPAQGPRRGLGQTFNMARAQHRS